VATSLPLRWLAASQLLLSALLLLGIWAALPARWWPIDVFGTALALMQSLAALGLLLSKPWGRRLARVMAWAALAAGATLVTALMMTLFHLAGLYGPVGAGGALLMGTMAALVAPYLVGLPVLQLRWLGAAE